MIRLLLIYIIGLFILMPVAKGQVAYSLAAHAHITDSFHLSNTIASNSGGKSIKSFPDTSQLNDTISRQEKVAEARLSDSSYTGNFITYFLPAVKGNSKVMLNWGVAHHNSDFFSLERSSNGKEFEVIAVMKQTPGITNYVWTDEDPAKGKNVYRIRTSLKSGTIVYSEAVAIMIAGNIAFKFYPNPVDNILIIRTEMPIDIQIIDATGKVRIRESRLQGLQTVNVSSLEKGVYFFSINDRQANTLLQEKLLKN